MDPAPGSRRLLQLSVFVSTLDRFAMPPMLIGIARDMDAPLTEVVRAAGVYFLAYGLMQPVWGVVSDRLGLVRTMRMSLLLASVATAASALVGSPLALAVTRGFVGATFSATYPASLIYIGDTVPVRSRQREVTNLMVGSAIGTAVGAAGGGAVAQLLTWRIMFLFTGVLGVVLVVALRHLAEPPGARRDQRPSTALRQVAASRPTWLVLLLAFGDGFVLLGVLTLLPPAIEAAGAGAALAGGVSAAFGVAMLVFARVTGALSRRLAAWHLMAVGAVAAVAGCAAAASSRSPVAGAVVATLLGLAWAALHSTLQTWATEVLPAARATVISLFAAAMFAGSAAAALIAAGPAQDGRYGELFVGATALAVALGLLAVWGRARWADPRDRTLTSEDVA